MRNKFTLNFSLIEMLYFVCFVRLCFSVTVVFTLITYFNRNDIVRASLIIVVLTLLDAVLVNFCCQELIIFVLYNCESRYCKSQSRNS